VAYTINYVTAPIKTSWDRNVNSVLAGFKTWLAMCMIHTSSKSVSTQLAGEVVQIEAGL